MVHFPGISSGLLLAEGLTKGFSKVEKLQMVEYDELKPFFMIEYCSEALIYKHFDSFMIKEEEEELQQQELPCRVQYLVLKDCKFPVKLEEALQSLTFLRGAKRVKDSTGPSYPTYLTDYVSEILSTVPEKRTDSVYFIKSSADKHSGQLETHDRQLEEISLLFIIELLLTISVHINAGCEIGVAEYQEEVTADGLSPTVVIDKKRVNRKPRAALEDVLEVKEVSLTHNEGIVSRIPGE
ncbi:hypothetical protein QYF36_023681 [Acer negundo]|nr:hypothetical protein QYF36_023681 [Acer negundo]